MDGFGAAITGSAAYLLQHADESDRNTLLNDLFTSSGINLSIVRHTIGASDFSVDANGNPSSYTYDDTNGEPNYNMNYFSILSLNSHLQVKGTPWTAPA